LKDVRRVRAFFAFPETDDVPEIDDVPGMDDVPEIDDVPETDGEENPTSLMRRVR
jgi:hypothetical protein